jgi:hypothetical protein
VTSDLNCNPVDPIDLRAVFLSYASEDATAAERICTTLRAAGIEVWFDRNALRGGDAWDATIRQQIKTCALFIPVISNKTQARGEGYFRLEWKLAVDRSHLMSTDQAFLVPVVIDDTNDAVARVPDRFREVQWTRLSGSLCRAYRAALTPTCATPGSAASFVSFTDTRSSGPRSQVLARGRVPRRWSSTHRRNHSGG